MQISPVRLSNYKNVKQNNTPSFKGEQSEKTYDIVIERLKKVQPEVHERFSIAELESTMSRMIEKYQSLGVRSVGLQVVNQKDLPKFLGDKVNTYNLQNKVGICVVVGDRFGSVENMTNIYEAHLFIATDEDLNK
ncbi:MAG: hypothetical protein IJ003_02285 [Candidatus Gastranaerophilales bacterium]|nr:hypothetical protein [Candidatus Gastranaerophilales bacterium]